MNCSTCKYWNYKQESIKLHKSGLCHHPRQNFIWVGENYSCSFYEPRLLKSGQMVFIFNDIWDDELCDT